MDAWAATYAGAASFVCVSCAGPQLAAQFGKQLKLKTCINTWADEGDMPTWGQLGCNGFIILDGDRNVVCKQSPAFLEVRERAFEYVDTLLSSLIVQNPKPPSTAAPSEDEQKFDGETGGCGKAANPSAKRPLEELASRAPVQVASVKNAALDAEHERCAAVLERLARDKSEDAARAVLHEYEVHFAHEEQLLDAHLFAGVAQQDQTSGREGFSADAGARRSHFNDHKRLLDGVRALLGKGALSSAAIGQVLDDFERHADAYDGSYADRLESSLAAAAVVS